MEGVMNGDITLTTTENRVLDMLRDMEKWGDVTIERKSDKEFDIHIKGEKGTGDFKCEFSAWMPLSIIYNANWADKRIWKLSDGYGSKGHIPLQGHDWSGIRDSSNEAIWDMMYVALRMLGIYVIKGR